MTRAIEILTSEHRVIELVLASLETFVEKVGSGIEDERVTLRDYLTFLKGFADQCHHGKEEDILFATMASRGFPEETGPLAVLHLEHIMGRGYIGALASIAEGSRPLTREEREILRTHALAYIGLLRAHIQKEDNVLYPVAARVIPSSEMEKVAERFDDFEAREAPGRHDTLHTLAERLVETFPPDPSRTASPGRGRCCSL
ncbi:MAG: hemerythrin [Acidobacteria bacterium]|nr:MAG: hemerythrin [Acidobacteriota bacterium]